MAQASRPFVPIREQAFHAAHGQHVDEFSPSPCVTRYRSAVEPAMRSLPERARLGRNDTALID
jgi:hypothetical protein